MMIPPNGLRGRSYCFPCVIFRLRMFCVFILKLASQSPVQFSVSSLPWRSRLGLRAPSLSVSAFLDLPAASCPFYRWSSYGTPLGGQTLSLQGLELHLDPLWERSVFYLCIDSAPLLECLHVPGIRLCSASTKVTVAGGTFIFRQAPPACCHTIPVHQPHSYFRI